MESSKLKVEEKNKLYFNKYRFKCKARIIGCSYTYYTYDIDTYLNRISKWKADSKRFRIFNTMSEDSDEYWDNIDITEIEKFINWRKANQNNDCLIRIQGDHASIFSNDIDLLESFKDTFKKTQMYEVRPLGNDSVFLKNPTPYKFRTFFKGKRVSQDFVETLLNFNKMYDKGTAKISPALIKYLENRNFNAFMYIHGSYFIDYVEESFLSMLHIHFPGMLAKTYKLEQRQ